MPEVRIPLKDGSGRLDPAIIPDVQRFPNATAAGSDKVPVSTAAGWDYVDAASLGGGTGGGSIAATRYAPTTPTAKSASTTALADLDASLLTASFTAPASGKVQVDLSATVKGSAAATRSYWGLRSGTSDVPDSLVMVHEGTVPARATASIIVTGLTPGQNYTYKWAAAASTGTTSLTAGGTATDATSGGQATMVVRDAPFG